MIDLSQHCRQQLYLKSLDDDGTPDTGKAGPLAATMGITLAAAASAVAFFRNQRDRIGGGMRPSFRGFVSIDRFGDHCDDSGAQAHKLGEVA